MLSVTNKKTSNINIERGEKIYELTKGDSLDNLHGRSYVIGCRYVEMPLFGCPLDIDMKVIN